MNAADQLALVGLARHDGRRAGRKRRAAEAGVAAQIPEVVGALERHVPTPHPPRYPGGNAGERERRHVADAGMQLAQLGDGGGALATLILIAVAPFADEIFDADGVDQAQGARGSQPRRPRSSQQTAK